MSCNTVPFRDVMNCPMHTCIYCYVSYFPPLGAMLCCIRLYCTVLLCGTAYMLCCIELCYVMLYGTVSYCAVKTFWLHFVLSVNFHCLPRYVMLCYVIRCSVVLCSEDLLVTFRSLS